MSLLKNFVNPWELDKNVLRTNVLETSVLDTSVLDNSVLDNTSSAEDEKTEFLATIHGSWWDDRIFAYLYEDTGHPLAKSALAALIQGALFQHKEYITNEVLAKYKNVPEDEAKKREISYRNKNWGHQNDYPVSITTGKGDKLKKLSSKEIKKIVKENGEFKIQIRTNGHNEKKKNIGGLMNRGSIIIKEITGLNASTGIHYWTTWFVSNSPFGKIARGSGIFREDPWTGQDLTDSDKIAMTFDGVLDLLTMGTSLGAAALNQGLNIIFQALANSEYSFKEEGMVREVIDIVASYMGTRPEVGKPMKGVHKYAVIEVIANLIQLGFLTYNYSTGKFTIVSEQSGGEEVREGLSKKYTITYEEE